MELLKAKVLVINKQWQGYEETDVETALKDMCRGSATGMDTEYFVPVTWAEWLKLPIREGDRAIQSLHGPVRVPTVICKARFEEMPKKRPKWSKKAVGERDGYTCQITGKYTGPQGGNVDHLLAQSRGGRNTFVNTVWTDKKVNTKKADKTLDELGWKLLKTPTEPPEIPMIRLIQPRHDDWKPFLKPKEKVKAVA